MASSLQGIYSIFRSKHGHENSQVLSVCYGCHGYFGEKASLVTVSLRSSRDTGTYVTGKRESGKRRECI